MSEYGISGGGRSAEEEFRALTGASPTSRAALGDALLDGVPIEIKRASASTINQVRAVKFIPLVVYDSRLGDWYVVPPNIVVALVSRKSRGQHTENPFESATLNVNSLAAYRVPHPTGLAAATRAAIYEGEQHPGLRAAMAQVLHDSREVAARSLRQVRFLLESGSEEHLG